MNWRIVVVLALVAMIISCDARLPVKGDHVFVVTYTADPMYFLSFEGNVSDVGDGLIGLNDVACYGLDIKNSFKKDYGSIPVGLLYNSTAYKTISQPRAPEIAIGTGQIVLILWPPKNLE
jgi:hypothetical protein